MKKLLAILLSVMMLFGVISCSTSTKESGKDSQQSDSLESQESIEDSSKDSSSESIGETVLTNYEAIPQYPIYSDVDLSLYTTYYFDSENGNDENDGLSESSPKQTVSAANRTIVKTKEGVPTRILFKAGSEYSSVLKIEKFSAKEETPLIIDVYGKTAEKQYAKFTAGPSCIEITSGNVRVSGMECSSISGLRGIYVYPASSGAMKNIVLKGNYLHDINFNFESGLPTSLQNQGLKPEDVDFDLVNVANVCANSNYIYRNSAIYFDANTSKAAGASWFENVWIDGNEIERVSRDAVFVTSNWQRRPGIDWGVNDYVSDEKGWYPHKNFNVINNNVSYTGGDGIVLIGVDGGFMQNNVSRHAQYLGRGGFYNAALWIHSCVNFVMQFNEASYTHKANGAGDGQGFDIDIGNKNILFQYNYSHHNEGGGILLCCKGNEMPVYDENGNLILDEYDLPILKYQAIWENVTVRNNVFADNDGAVFTYSDVLKNLDIVNNTIIMKGESGNERITGANGFFSNILGSNWRFINNLVYLRNNRTISFSFDYCPDAVVSNNLFYNFKDSIFDYVNATATLNINPGFENVVAKDGIENVNAFISNNSAILNSGLYLDYMSSVDFGGETAENKNYIGAFSTIK